MSKLGDSPVHFSANPDGSLSFSITVTGTLTPHEVRESLGYVQRRLLYRMRFDEMAVELGDIIISLPNPDIQAYVDTCNRALEKRREA